MASDGLCCYYFSRATAVVLQGDASMRCVYCRLHAVVHRQCTVYVIKNQACSAGPGPERRAAHKSFSCLWIAGQ